MAVCWKSVAVAATLISALMLSPSSAKADSAKYEVYLEKGLVELDAGALDEAVDNFEDALKLSPDSVEVMFYLGQAYWKSGDVTQGAKYFREVVDKAPDTDFGKVAKKYLDAIKVEKAKNYYIQLYSGPQYDTNVPVKPESKFAASIKERVDWAWVFYIRGGYNQPIFDGLSVGTTYDFYQDIHTEISNFDIKDHDLKAFLSYSKGPLVGFVTYNLKYTYLGSDSFERVHGVSPKLRLLATPDLTVEATYTYEDKGFLTNNRRDAINNRYEGDAYYYFMNRMGVVRAGYYHDVDNAFGEEWDYEGDGLTGGVSVPLPLDMRLSGETEFQHRRFGRGRSLDHLDFRNREDDIMRYTLSLDKQLTKKLGVLVSYTNIDNKSTFAEFDYDRELVTLYFTAKF